MKTLSKSELLVAESDLQKRYRKIRIVKGSLRNCSTRGKFKNKRTVKVKCHCGHVEETSSQELWHLVCSGCGESVAKPAARHRHGEDRFFN